MRAQSGIFIARLVLAKVGCVLYLGLAYFQKILNINLRTNRYERLIGCVSLFVVHNRIDAGLQDSLLPSDAGP